MSSVWPFLLLVLATVRWWWPVWETLRADLVAGEEEPPPERAPAPARWLRVSPDASRRVPPNRVLAFQGVVRRARARRRWEGGFGRRNP